MESTLEIKKTEVERKMALEQWLIDHCGIKSFNLNPMKSDASFRRYYRIQNKNQSWVAMDAKPPYENVYPFVAIAKALSQRGLTVPEIYQADFKQGFLLLTDFGDATYLHMLTANNSDKLYGQALQELACLQSCPPLSDYVIPPFTADFMFQEWEWHKEWFLTKLLHLPYLSVNHDLDACYTQLIKVAVSQPEVFMHRDYHSSNLMVLANGNTGILDFQDAFFGPVTYDVVSLLRDCYIDWPKEWVYNWAFSYLRILQGRGQLEEVSQEDFQVWFDFMGIQRHLKALLTFARKAVRDHQSDYLKHGMRTLNYIVDVSQRYTELVSLYQYYKEIVMPAVVRAIT